MKGKLVMLKGLPASGKSTFALRQVRASSEGKQPLAVYATVRVNKDDIRDRLNVQWSRDVEKEVLRIRDFEISQALAKGLTVISDDTNLAPKHEKRLRSLAEKYGAEFSVNDSFLGVSLEECILRDSQREEKVGEQVIRGMHLQFLANREPLPVVVYKPNPSTPSAIICDLDGTLALHNDRSPYDLSRCGEDSVNRPIELILEGVKRQGVTVLFVSGRDESGRKATSDWLIKNGWEDHLLYMRSAGDNRKDSIVKRELFDTYIRNTWNVRFVLDDRDQVVKMWRELGLTCLQVAYGDF